MKKVITLRASGKSVSHFRSACVETLVPGDDARQETSRSALVDVNSKSLHLGVKSTTSTREVASLQM